MPMMTKAVSQNQQKIFRNSRCTGTRSRKRSAINFKFVPFSSLFYAISWPGVSCGDSRIAPRVIILWAMHRCSQFPEHSGCVRIHRTADQACGADLLYENRCCDQKGKTFVPGRAQQGCHVLALGPELPETFATNQIQRK